MNRSIAVRGLGTLVLCVAVAGCASIAPVPYSEMASSAYMGAGQIGRLRPRALPLFHAGRLAHL
ncbi:hypothetical protein AB7M75_005912 [Bradyrhizobium ottawaense]